MADGDAPRDDGSHAGEGRRPEYRLTARERNFILNEDAGTDRPSRLKENIREKLDRQPSRIRALFRDFEVLKLGGYFEPQEWESGWRDVMGVKSTTDIEEQFRFAPRRMFDSSSHSSTPAVRFGEDLGKMVRRFNLYPHDVDKTDVLSDFIFGFINGLYFHNWDRAPRVRTEHMDLLLEKVEERAEIRFGEEVSEEARWFDQYTEPRRKETRAIQRITEVLEDEDIDYPRAIAHQVYRIIEDEERGDENEAPDNQFIIYLNRFIADSVWNSINNITLPSDCTADRCRRNLRDLHWSFVGEWRSERRRDLPGSEAVSADRVMDIVDQHELVARTALRERIGEDIEKLKYIQWAGVSALYFIEHMEGTLSPVSSRDIADEMGSPQEQLSKVVKLGLYLIGEEQIEDEHWNGFQLIEMADDGAGQFGAREWRLTDYGSAVRSTHLRHAHSVTSLNGDVYSREHFENALTDLILRDEL